MNTRLSRCPSIPLTRIRRPLFSLIFGLVVTLPLLWNNAAYGIHIQRPDGVWVQYVDVSESPSVPKGTIFVFGDDSNAHGSLVFTEPDGTTVYKVEGGEVLYDEVDDTPEGVWVSGTAIYSPRNGGKVVKSEFTGSIEKSPENETRLILNFATSGIPTRSYEGDGRIDGLDYLIWQRQH